MRLLFFVSETQCKKTDFTIELQKENPYNYIEYNHKQRECLFMNTHSFSGRWITNTTFAAKTPLNVFHRQLEPIDLPCEDQDQHILFRKKFTLTAKPERAAVYISADDRYRLYINGRFAAEGPTAAYPWAYGYNTVDVTDLLSEGENTVAVHTLYYGVVNRVCVSADERHGLLLDLECDGKTAVSSDTTFRTAIHTAYTPTGIIGYNTQFAEDYDASAPTVGFWFPGYDDSQWENASLREHTDYVMTAQPTGMPVFEKILPAVSEQRNGKLFLDFGGTRVGYLNLSASGHRGDRIIIRCGQELDPDGNVRYEMRCNCRYEENMILSGGNDNLDWFDFKSFRYAELILPEGCTVSGIYMTARHYPFSLAVTPRFTEDPDILRIWKLCTDSVKYGVQEVIQDCMDREKGFYVGDGCYTALTQMILTGDDSMVRYLIDSSRETTRFLDTTVTCLCCSMMQEIAEYPLIMVYLMLWHFRLTGDRDYLEKNYAFAASLLDCYRRDYEKELLLCDLDKWCVVEWPENFQDNYDVDIREGKVCTEPHCVINAYYLRAVMTVNTMAEILGKPLYRDTDSLKNHFAAAFYDPERKLFTDSLKSSHCSYVANAFCFGLGLAPDRASEENILAMLEDRGFENLHLFSAFPVMMRLAATGRDETLKRLLTNPGMWLRMLGEGATTTFEAWSKELKWNTSLFHLTFSYAALFIAGIDHKALFESF